MIAIAKIKELNKELTTIEIHGKPYAPTHERVKAFRELCPGGSIITEIVKIENGVVIIKATVLDEDNTMLSTGHAYEKEGSSSINRTSYIENCETSAVGRALGFLGIGIDTEICSADEYSNAFVQKKEITKLEKETLRALLERKGESEEYRFPYGMDGITVEQYAKAVKWLETLPDRL